jgi:inhibitor of the pro-sigma K processing machinery
MTENQILIIIIVACLVIMGIAIVVKKTHIIAGILLKSALGLVAIYVMNEVLMTIEVHLPVGMNVGTALTIGFLGFPGFIMLYILAIYDAFM